MGTVFFHIDLDAFFASVEELLNPSYRGKPLIIGHPGPRSVVSTCSYEARKYGVHSAMPMTTALRLCPNAICIDGNYRLYEEKSHEVMNIIEAFAPGFLQVSIDEAFLDMTGMERLYGMPGKAAGMLKSMIKEKTGLTASIGVASSRYVAKLASDYRKPEGLTIVPPGRETDFVDSIELGKLWGIGKASLESLNRKGIRNARDIRMIPIEELRRLFGETSASFLYNASRGIDPGIFQKEAKSHSISAETTFRNDVHEKEAKRSLSAMSEDLMLRAMDEKTIPRSVTVKIRYGEDFRTTTIQEKPRMAIYSSSDVFSIASRLFMERYSGEGIRLIGLALGDLYKAEEVEQKDLFDEVNEKKRTLEKTVLSLRRSGNMIRKASNLDEDGIGGERE